MYKKRIIPCLDIKNGRVVKGINFLNLIDIWLIGFILHIVVFWISSFSVL